MEFQQKVGKALYYGGVAVASWSLYAMVVCSFVLTAGAALSFLGDKLGIE